MKFKSIACAILLSVAFLAPTFTLAQVSVSGGVNVSGSGWSIGVSVGDGSGGGVLGVCPVAICGVAGTIISIINSVLVPVLFALAFIVFLWGIAKAYIFSGGDPAKVAEGHKLALWGVVAFAIMLSLWGLVNVVAQTFGLSGATAPLLPRSY